MRWPRLNLPTKKSGAAAPNPVSAARPPASRRRWRWPSILIDLNQPKHRRNLLLAFAALALVGVSLLIGSLKAYEYTESSEFCGATCHVMAPQFVRYEESPHANVECAKCHIGPGASFFVKSKIDGLRQVIAVVANTYSHPIKSPVKNLRPARETCETCHTPTSFKDNIVKTIVHYDNDAVNTRIQSTLILKMGGWQESASFSQGIHWHINSEVSYIAADEQRQVILWVGVKQPDGSLKEYYARDVLAMAQTSFVEKARDEGQVRLMDCIDCHNRAAHSIPSPQAAVDDAITAGKIPAEVPFIRAQAIEILTPAYASQSEAYAAIQALGDSYRAGNVGGGASSSIPATEKLEIALAAIREIYDATNFPEMDLNWQTNPDNEMHTPFPGCFRCHDGKHINIGADGKELETISVKCNLCHTVPIVGRGEEVLIEAPVIVGATPPSHADFRWTIEHRSVTESDKQVCLNCHGQGFCNNGACHNLSHPEDMLYTHAEEYRTRGDQVCYNCHQNILCSRCHPGGIVTNP